MPDFQQTMCKNPISVFSACLWFICACFTLALTILNPALMNAQESQPSEGGTELSKPLGDHWIDMGLGPPLVDWFTEWARPTDIARANHPDQLELLDDISAARKLVVFKSAADAEQRLPEIADRFDILGYNLEHGPTNPEDEIADPVASVRRMRALADIYGLELAMGPDHSLAVDHGKDIAPYVDYFILQIQRVQTEPEQVKAFVIPIVAEIRRANPDVQVSVQVRTEGDVKAITELLADLEHQIDGISILTSPETVQTAVALVAAIRPSDSIPDLQPVEAVGVVTPNTPKPSSLQPESQLDLLRYGFVVGSVTTVLLLGFLVMAAVAGLLWILLLTNVQSSSKRRSSPSDE